MEKPGKPPVGAATASQYFVIRYDMMDSRKPPGPLGKPGKPPGPPVGRGAEHKVSIHCYRLSWSKTYGSWEEQERSELDARRWGRQERWSKSVDVASWRVFRVNLAYPMAKRAT
jgi:hypothetical protein